MENKQNNNTNTTKNNFELIMEINLRGICKENRNSLNRYRTFNIGYEVKRFFSGELSVVLDNHYFNKVNQLSEGSSEFHFLSSVDYSFLIKGQVKDSDSLIELCMLSNALDNILKAEHKTEKVFKRLEMPYMIGSRGDRVMQRGGSFDLQVYSQIINSLGFDSVVVTTPHSQATEIMVNNVDQFNIKQKLSSSVFSVTRLKSKNNNDFVLVAPDAGASKRVGEIAKEFHAPVVQAIKQRSADNSSVKTTLFLGDIDPIETPIAIIVDDILDGGRTFIETAKELKEKGFTEVYLIIDHAMFSYGDNGLFDFIDEIYYTNEWDGVRDRLSPENSNKAILLD